MGKKNNQARLKDYLAFWIYRLLECTLRFLPTETVWTIGYLLGSLTHKVMHQRRNTVIRNLRIVFGKSKSLEEIEAMAKRTFQHTGANLICSFKITNMSAAEIRARMQISHPKRVDDTRKNGGIMLLAHMGNWELLTQLPVISKALSLFGTLYRPLNNPVLDKLIRKRRQQQGVITFSRRDGFFKPISHLKQGGLLGAIADQNAGKHGIALPLFGKLTSVTNLPALLHRRSGAPIVPASMRTIAPGQWKLDVSAPVTLSPEDRKDTFKGAAITTSLYQKILTSSPEDVLWMHRYWRVGKRRPLAVDGLIKPQSVEEITQPFQVLVFTGRQDRHHTDTITQLERLQSYRADINIITTGKTPLFPAADHIPYNPEDPPHILSNAIRAYDRQLHVPIDCALDFTERGEGGKILSQAGIDSVFCRHGKWMSPRTRRYFTEKGSNNLALMLTSLGIDSGTPVNNPETPASELTTS